MKRAPFASGIWLTVLLLLWSVPAAAGLADFRLQLISHSPEAIGGVPVVVEIRATNRSAAPAQIADLSDPDLALIRWEWTAVESDRKTIELDDYFLSAVPEPAFPRILTVAPGQRISFFHTLPTPLDFADSAQWTLTATLADPGGGTTETLQLTLHGRTPHVVTPEGRKRFALLQAASLERSRSDVWENRAAELEEICDEVGESDVRVKLARVSKALLRDKKLQQRWRQLDEAPREVEAVRNFLLEREIQDRSRRGRALPKSLRAVAHGLQENAPFRGAVSDQLSKTGKD